jgi:protein SCO1/2
MKKNTLFIVIVILSALGVGIWRDDKSASTSHREIQKITVQSLSAGTLITNSKKLPDFSLVDMNGNPFTQESLKKHWSFLFFGYSSCPNICPSILGSLQQISQRLRQNPHVQFLVVTINPEVDTASQLKAYFDQEKFANTKFIGLTGDKDKIMEFAKIVGSHVERENPQEEHIEHSGTFFLIDPEGKLAAIFTSNSNPIAIAGDFKEIAHRFAQST